jgi:hypothetical protein
MAFRPTRATSPTFLIATLLLAIVVAGRGILAQHSQRTPDGHPDFQGMWLNDTATPLERPRDFSDRPSLSDAEAREYEKRYQLDRTAAISPLDPVFDLKAAADLDTYEPGHLLPGNRTAMIIDPPDGRVPALTSEAQRRLTAQTDRLRTHYAENPENFPNTERCLVMANSSSPPMLPVFYNNNVQIVQTRDYVMILSEMIHDARIIPLATSRGGRTHLPAGIGQWLGNSIARWEGETLVVDTTNFTDKTTVRGSGPRLHVVERFTQIDPKTLRYQFTVEDPASFTRAWSGESAMTRTDGRMYEYACHEANYSLASVMRGAR